MENYVDKAAKSISGALQLIDKTESGSKDFLAHFSKKSLLAFLSFAVEESGLQGGVDQKDAPSKETQGHGFVQITGDGNLSKTSV